MAIVGKDVPKIAKCPIVQKDENGDITKNDDGTNKICGKDIRHGANYSSYGTNERDEEVTTIAFEVLQEAKFIPKGLKTRDHFFCRQGDESLLYRHPDGKIRNGPQSTAIEGHHLITIEAVESEEWYCLFYAMQYNINCAANCVLLPGDMLSACHYGVQRHKGGHSATIGENDLNYVASVIEMIQPTLDMYRIGTYCDVIETETFKAFHETMLGYSNDILEFIKGFIWTISADGLDYKTGGVGCCGGFRNMGSKKSTKDKIDKMLELMPENRKSDVMKDGFTRKDFSQLFIDKSKETNEFKYCDRNHSNEGCILPKVKIRNIIPREMTQILELIPAGKASVVWSQCKFNDIDELIKKM